MLRILSAFALLTLAIQNANARPIFLPDFSPSATVETFESLPTGFQPNPLTLNGVTYSGVDFLAVDNGFPLFANMQPPNSSLKTLYSSGSTLMPFIIDFATPVDRVGLLLSSGGSLNWILTALDSSFNVLENTFIFQPGPSQAAFGGFENFAGIRQLRVQVAIPNSSALFPHFDDVRYERVTAIPEPSTSFLIAAALIALGVSVRRRIQWTPINF